MFRKINTYHSVAEKLSKGLRSGEVVLPSELKKAEFRIIAEYVALLNQTSSIADPPSQIMQPASALLKLPGEMLKFLRGLRLLLGILDFTAIVAIVVLSSLVLGVPTKKAEGELISPLEFTIVLVDVGAIIFVVADAAVIGLLSVLIGHLHRASPKKMPTASDGGAVASGAEIKTTT